MVFTPYVTLLGLNILGIHSWHSLIIPYSPGMMRQHSRTFEERGLNVISLNISSRGMDHFLFFFSLPVEIMPRKMSSLEIEVYMTLHPSLALASSTCRRFVYCKNYVVGNVGMSLGTTSIIKLNTMS